MGTEILRKGWSLSSDPADSSLILRFVCDLLDSGVDIRTVQVLSLRIPISASIHSLVFPAVQ